MVRKAAAGRYDMGIKDRLKNALYQLRNPQRSENEGEFMRQLSTKRLFFLLPFLIAGIIMLLLSFR
jgi:hypothetical protein